MLILEDFEKAKGIPPIQASTAQHHFVYKTHITLKGSVLVPPVVQIQTLQPSMKSKIHSLTQKATTRNTFQFHVSPPPPGPFYGDGCL